MRKQYPPSSRKSARLNSESVDRSRPTDDEEEINVTNDPVAPRLSAQTAAEDRPNDNDRPNNNDKSHSDGLSLTIAFSTPFPRSPDGSDDEMTVQEDMAAELAALREELAQLRATLAGNDNKGREVTSNNNGRGVTSDNCAFESEKFVPTGLAAYPAFTPYGSDQKAPNKDYDRTAKATGVDPGKFNGDKHEFDKWVTRLADKLEEDNETFKTERSRMVLLFSLLVGTPQDLVYSRYKSTVSPFSSAAEMVQALSTVYHDDNQVIKARQKLQQMRYKLGDKTDIHQFIGEVNALADIAGHPITERKIMLWECIPADLDSRLLRDAKDPRIKYEEFASNVADAAQAHQRAYEARQKAREANRRRNEGGTDKYGYRDDRDERKTGKSSSKSRNTASHKTDTSTKKPSEAVTVLNAHRALTRDEKQVHWDANTCFVCGRTGHKGTDCPNREKIPSVRAVRTLDGRMEESGDSSSSESENE